jgi:aspartate dehydrogenase
VRAVRESRGTAWPRKKRLKIALDRLRRHQPDAVRLFREKKPDIDIVGVLVRPGRAKETQKKVGRKVAGGRDAEGAA